MLKALSVLKILKFDVYDVINWETNNCDIYIAQYFKKKDNQTIKFGQLIEYNRNIILEKSCTKRGGETCPRPFSK